MIVTICTDLHTQEEFIRFPEARRWADHVGAVMVAFDCEIITIYVGF